MVDPGNRFVRGLDMLSGVLVYDSYFTMGTPTTLAVYDTENVPSILGMSNKHGIVQHSKSIKKIKLDLT